MNDSDINKNSSQIKSFSNDVLIFSFGQFIILVIGVIKSFLIPKYLPIIDYGYWQLFLLYTSYVGILHLGFLDGIYIRWAGKEIETFIGEIPKAFTFIIFQQILFSALLISLIIIIDLPLKGIAIAILFNAIIVNVLWFFKFIAQSTKQFKLVTSLNVVNGLLFLLSIVILLSISFFNYLFLIMATISTGLIVLSVFIFYYRKYLSLVPFSGSDLFQYGKKNINIGLYILLGNFIIILFISIDRFIVNSLLPLTQFAIYAFAMSMCALTMVFLQAVAQVFLPYLSGFSSRERLVANNLLKPTIIIIWAGMLTVAFPISTWILYYLPEYAASLPIIGILLCTIVFNGQIQIVHANFFKVYRKEREYFLTALIALIAAIVLNVAAVYFIGTLTSVAIMMIISFIIWYCINEYSLRNFIGGSLWIGVKWIIIMLIYIIGFSVMYHLSDDWMYGMIAYLIFFVVISFLFLRIEFIRLISLAKIMFKYD